VDTPKKRRRIPKEILANLKHVKVSKPRINISRFPDFLILGPQRTGTGWMRRNLKRHPQIFVTTPKELYYFDTLGKPSHPRHRSDDLVWYLNFFRDTPRTYLEKCSRMWRWHRELYRPKVRGEACASYAALDKEVIKEVVALNPHIKGIILIRNPVDRAWSHAKKDLLKEPQRKFSEVPAEEFERFFHRPYQVACAQYTRMVDNWSAVVKEGNLFVGAFDEMRHSPEDLLLRLFAFLGVRSDPRYLSFLARKQISQTETLKLPDKWRAMLEEMFADEMKRIEKRFGLSWK